MLFGILIGGVFLLVIPVMVGLGTTLALYLWRRRWSAQTRVLVASFTGPGVLFGPVMFAPAIGGDWSAAPVLGIAFILLLLGGLCFPFVRMATRRLEQLHSADISVFN
jgi:hypothetical protein